MTPNDEMYHALKLVLELAEQNALANQHATTRELRREYVRQRNAILKVQRLTDALKPANPQE